MVTDIPDEVDSEFVECFERLCAERDEAVPVSELAGESGLTEDEVREQLDQLWVYEYDDDGYRLIDYEE